MYKVSIFNDDVETVIHSPHSDELKLETGTIKKEINKIDRFSIGFYMNNPAYGKLKPFKTLVKVLNTKTNKYEFEGRVLAPSETMSEDGLYDAAYDCEGELGYLHDSVQRHLEFRGTPKELFTQLLNYHNQQVEDYKQFSVGEFEVTTSTDNLYIYLSAEKSTFEEIDDKILGRVGGEIRVRKENGTRYLDVLERVGEQKQTPIKIAKNLRSMSRSVDPTEIITRLTPLGTRISSEDEGATDASEARLTIEDVNNGLPYIDDLALINEFGIQGGSITWDDITQASRLLSSANNWLANQKTVHVQYEISALDLFLIGLDIDSFDIGNSHRVVNPIMGIDENLRIIGKTTNINSPQESSLKIGDKFKNLDEYQADANKSARNIIELENTVSRQNNKIGSLSTDLSNAKTELEQTKQQLQDFENITDEDLIAITSSINTILTTIDQLEQLMQDIPETELAGFETNGLMSSMDYAKLYGINWYVNASNPDFRIYDHNVYIYYAFQALDEEYSEGLEVGGGYYYLGRLLEKMARKIDEYETRLTILEGGA